MVATEVHPEKIAEDNRTDQWLEQDYYNEEEAEETLSFCDLPIYSSSLKSDDRFCSYKEDYQSSSDDQDLFEFFREDFSTASSTCAYAEENIIFCGKLIPHQNPEAISQKTTHKYHQINKKQPPPPPKKKRSFFQWRSKIFYKSKTSKDNTAKRQTNSNTSKKSNSFEPHKISGSKILAFPASKKCSATKKYGYSVKKVSILTSPTKSSWHLFFGLARLPTKMELSDMRSRQHRLTPSFTLFPLFDEANKGKEVKADRSNREKRLWRLLRVLGC